MSIRMEQVTVKLGQTSPTTILDHIEGTIEDGQITLIIGKTGSGKSTLLDVLSGLIPVTSGMIWYDKQPLWNGNRVNQTLSNSIGNVFQYPEHQLFARTVKGEIEYSLKPFRLTKNEVEKRAESSLQAVRLDLAILPQSPLVLSSGQKRRVSLASTFAPNPTWLFLDEPTAGLDPAALQHLLEWTVHWKEKKNGGLVIATHDLDAFLPMADQVFIMKEGKLFASISPNELYDRIDLLQDAEIGVPTPLKVASLFRDKGMVMPPGWLSPEQMAQSIATLEPGSPPGCQGIPSPPMLSMSEPHQMSEEKKLQFAVSKWITDIDPRVKWLFYLLFSMGILGQSTWMGLFYATFVSALVIVLSRVPFRDMLRFLMPFFIFIVISIGFSGVEWNTPNHFGGLWFSFINAIHTLKQMFRILLIMALGVWLPLTTSHVKIKKGIEQTLAWVPGMATIAEAIALGASLTLRFIPMLMKETNRFSKIVRARGKSRAKPGSLRVKDLRAVMTPLLLSVFQLADNLSTAMEVRGYHRLGQKRTSSVRLKMNRKDIVGIAIGIFLSLILFLIK